MFKFLKLSLFLLLMPWILQAQFNVSGVVVNSNNGEKLPGANVILTNAKTAVSTGSNGKFMFENIKKGKYTLKVSYIGFETWQKQITVDKNINLTIKLKPAVYMSDEVIISALRVQGNNPSAVENIDGERISKTNSGQDLPYLLKMTPSVVVNSDAGTGIGYTTLRIRGVDLTGINVTLNGVPVNDPESQTVYFVDLPDLASSVDNIQIQRGVGTSTAGAASFGASINIKTDRFVTEPYAVLNSSAGSFNTFKNSINFGSGLLSKHWLVTGRLSQISSDGYIDRAFSKLKSAYLSAGYYGKKDIVKAIGMWGHERTYQAWYGVPKDSLNTNRTYNPAGEIYDNNGNFLGYYDNQTDNYTQNYYQLHYAHNFNGNLNAAATSFLTRGYGYYESYKNNQKFSKYGMNDTVIGGDTVSRTNLIRQKWLDNYYYGVNASLNYSGSRLDISAGGGWNRYHGDHFGKIVWAQVARLGDYDRNWYFNTGIKTELNVFVKTNYHITEKLNLNVDLQYRKIDYSIEGTHDDLRDLTQNHHFGFFNPKAGLYYSFGSNQQAYFTFAVSNREPNRSVYRDADPGQEIFPERLYDYEAGYKYSNAKMSLHAGFYYMRYKNQFVLTGKINNVGTPVMTNVPDSYRTGIEFAYGWKILKTLEWQFNTTLSRNIILNFTEYVDNWNYWYDPANQPYQYENFLGSTNISFSPGIIAASNLKWKAFKNFDISWMSKYVGKQYIDNTSSDERSLNPYWVNNLVLGYSVFPDFLKSIDITLQLNNVLDRKYETNAWVYRYIYGEEEYEMNGYFPQAGFNLMLGLRVKL